MSRRKTIEAAIEDLVSNFIYYNRKEDEELGVGEIEDAVKNGEISIEEIVGLFERRLRHSLRSR